MEGKTLVVIILIIFIVYMYKNPQGGHDLIAKGVNAVSGAWDKVMAKVNLRTSSQPTYTPPKANYSYTAPGGP